jgi:hypothetical protein
MVAFIHGPQIMLVGTRSKALRPAARRVAGAYAEPEADAVTIFVPDCEGRAILENAADNGRIAVVLIDAATHRSYQLKGQFLESHPSTEREKAIRDLYLEKLIVHMRVNYPIPLPENHFRNFIMEPSTSLRFRLEAIFNQTPGPGAGKPVAFTPGP